jgi:hypothetical protein
LAATVAKMKTKNHKKRFIPARFISTLDDALLLNIVVGLGPVVRPAPVVGLLG